MTTASSDFVIVRPTRRCFRRQVIGLLALGVVGCLCGRLFAADPIGVYVAVFAVAAVGFTGQFWAYSRSPRAIVATPGFVGFLHGSGAREYIRWEQIQGASHATGLWGMRWSLTCAGGSVTVRDLGVSSESWGRLWRAIVQEVSHHRGSVWVDPISDTVFSE